MTFAGNGDIQRAGRLKEKFVWGPCKKHVVIASKHVYKHVDQRKRDVIQYVEISVG